MFAARAALDYFLKTVQVVYPQGGDQAAAEERAVPKQPWLGFWGEYRKKARSSGSGELDGELDGVVEGVEEGVE